MQCSTTGGMMWMNSDVTLSSEWKTIELRHIAIAHALLPYDRQYTEMISRRELGNTQTASSSMMLTK